MYAVVISAGMTAVAGAFFELHKVTSSQTAHTGPTQAGMLALVGLVVFIASFAFSLGPVVWTVINEVFQSHVRGRQTTQCFKDKEKVMQTGVVKWFNTQKGFGFIQPDSSSFTSARWNAPGCAS